MRAGLSNSKISLQQFDILVCTYAKCGSLIGWAACMFITDHKLIIIIIVRSANICIHCLYRKSFRPAYSQLGMLGARSCTNCNSNWANKIHQLRQELHASPHIEHFPILSYPYISIYRYVLSIYGYVGKHEVLTSTSLGNVDPEIIAVNASGRTFSTQCSAQPHAGDDKIKVLLLPYTAKLQVVRKMMPPTVIYPLSLWTLYIEYNLNIWPQNSIPWLRIFLTWPDYLICITTKLKRNCTCLWKVKI